MFNVFTSLWKKAKNNHISCIFTFLDRVIYEKSLYLCPRKH